MTNSPGGCATCSPARTRPEADLAHAGALDGDDLPGEEAEEIESEVADAATASRTIAELHKELAILADLIELARQVRRSGTDKK